MLRRVAILVFVAVAVVQGALAQQLSESYHQENPEWVDAELWAAESQMQSMPRTPRSPFENYSRFGFMSVAYGFRGESVSSLTTRLGAVDVASPLDSYPDYTLLNLLRRIPSVRTNLWSNTHSEWGADVRSELFLPSVTKLPDRHSLRIGLSSRSYRLASYYSSVGGLDSLWRYSLLVGGKWGRDGNVEGLFTDEENLWLSVERAWGEGVTRRLQLALLVAPTQRSLRSWNSDEVFALSGDRHYNSYWGWQQGKVRSSRIRRECVPMLYGSFDIDDGYLLSNINLSTLLRAGRKSSSTLQWDSAPNPLPDYYLYLPSAQSDPEVALLAREVWLRGDERFTQLDWQGLYTANSLSTSGARYALLEEREDILSAQVDASAALVGIEPLRLGLRLSRHATHNHNLPLDLLGAQSLTEGFRRYDYRVSHSAWELYLSHHRNTAEWGECSLAAEFGGVAMDYFCAANGYKHNAEHLTASLVARWNRALNDRATMGADARYECCAPHWKECFGLPEGAATTNPYARSEHLASADVWGYFAVGELSFHSTLFARYEGGKSRVEHFWNDLAGCYSTMLAGDLESLTYGAELSVEVSVSPNFSATLHTTLLSSRYISDGVGDVVEHNSGAPLSIATPIRLRGRSVTSSPGSATALVLRYYAPRGWMVGGSWSYLTRREMPPSLFLCSDEVLSRALTPEALGAITSPQSLGSAHLVDLFASCRRGNVLLSVSVKNLLNFTSSYRDGYQPSRLSVRESDYTIDYAPHAPRYQYIYPRYLLLSATYEF